MRLLNTEMLENYTRLGVGVSGGSDSLALLVLLAEWAKARGREVFAVTLDHGLRTESGDEARYVGTLAQRLGIEHDILTWQRPEMRGNLCADARHARYQKIGKWAQEKQLEAVCLGHTSDDVAETFMMRLGRGAGLEGLAAMQSKRESDGMVWVRPLLEARRQDLRNFLCARGVKWRDDPSNEDTGFARIRVRKGLNLLEEMGVTPASITQSATNLRKAADALSNQRQLWIKQNVTLERGEVHIRKARFARLDYETQFRILSGILKWLGQRAYAPRGRSIERLLSGILRGQKSTLWGCVIWAGGDDIFLTREVAHQPHILACHAHKTPYDGLWDVKIAPNFLADADNSARAFLAPVGADGLRMVENWRTSGLSRYGAMATPALWRDGALLDAPVLAESDRVHAAFIGGALDELYLSFQL